jgi:hypothetical protein
VPEAIRSPRGLPDPDSSGRPTFFRFGALTDIGASGSVKQESGTVESWRPPLSEGRVTYHGAALFAYSPKVGEGVFSEVGILRRGA